MPAVDIQADQIPDGLMCPISHELFDDPVLLPVVIQQAKNGAFIFSRQAIEIHLGARNFTCPMSKQVVLHTTPRLIPIAYKKREVDNWLKKNNLLTFEEFWALIETDNYKTLAAKRYPSHFLTNKHPIYKKTAKEFAKDRQLNVARIIQYDENNLQPFIPTPEMQSTAAKEAKSDAKSDTKDEKSTSAYVIDIDIPEQFRDPVHKGLMSNPVVTLDGIVLDSDSISTFFPTNYINPATGLAVRTVFPLMDLKQQIASFLERHRCHSISDIMNIIQKGDVTKLRSKRYLKSYLLQRIGERRTTLLFQAAKRSQIAPILDALWQDILQAFGTEVADKLLNAQNINGDTALHYAVVNKSIDAICWLIKNKAKTINNNSGQYPLWSGLHLSIDTDAQLNLAAKEGRFQDLQKLLNLQLDNGKKFFYPEANGKKFFYPEAKSVGGKTPLFCAIENGKLDCAQLLFGHSPKAINIPDQNGNTPLHAAVANGHLSCVVWLIKGQEKEDLKADLSIKNAAGLLPLEMTYDQYKTPILTKALVEGNLECAKLLLMCCPQMAVQPNAGQWLTPLHNVARSRLPRVYLDTFLEQKNSFNINVFDCVYQTPLIYAARERNIEFVRILIEAGADPWLGYITNGMKYTVLSFFPIEERDRILWLREEMFFQSLNKGEEALRNDIDALLLHGDLRPKGKSLFHWLAEKGYSTLLLNLATKPALRQEIMTGSCRDTNGLTPEMAALKANQPSTALFILRECRRFNYLGNEDQSGMTALLYAAQIGSLSVIHEILASKSKAVDINKTTKEGQNAFLLAVANGHLDCAKELYAYFPTKNVEERKLLQTQREMALRIAIQNDDVAMINFLSTKGVLNKKTEQSNFFRLAIKGGKLKAAKHLFEACNNNLSIDCTGTDGKTPLLLAFQYRHKHCVEWLITEHANINSARSIAKKQELYDVAKHIEAFVMHKALASLSLEINALDLYLKKYPWLINQVIDYDCPAQGLTLLHLAILHGNQKAVALLLKHGAKTDIKCPVKNLNLVWKKEQKEKDGKECKEGEDSKDSKDTLISLSEDEEPARQAIMDTSADAKDTTEDTTQEMTARELVEYEVNRLSISDDKAAKATSIAIAKLVNPTAKDSKKRKSLSDDADSDDLQHAPSVKTGTAQTFSKKARTTSPASQKSRGLQISPSNSENQAKMATQSVGIAREYTIFALKQSNEERISLTKTTAVQAESRVRGLGIIA